MLQPVPLEHGKYYHIYNRGNNRENLFVEDRNYRYFLQLYAKYIEPVADTFAYCLMRNHFHVLIRIKDLTGLQDLSGLKQPSQAFSNLFNAYARAFNKVYQRTGALFERPFGRIEVDSDVYFARLIIYIHQNPQKHGFVADFSEWPFSSYHTLLSTQPTRLKRDEVLGWFGSATDLAATHRELVVEQHIATLAPEDYDFKT
ncbi:MAG: transposase [Thermoflexales bacterium]|nr:transposase [Thermoflexales bacterium]